MATGAQLNFSFSFSQGPLPTESCQSQGRSPLHSTPQLTQAQACSEVCLLGNSRSCRVVSIYDLSTLETWGLLRERYILQYLSVMF